MNNKIKKQNQKHNIRFATYMMIASALGFASMAVFVKLAGDIPATQKSIFRSTTTLIISIIILFKSLKNTTFLDNLKQINNYKALAIRSIFGTAGIILNYYAIDHLMISDANIIFRMSTIFVIIFSFIFLKEKMNKTQISVNIQ